MKIAIAAETTDPNTQVSPHGARATYYLIYDDKGNFQEILNNPHAGAERGAGPKAAHYLMQQGVTLVVAGGFGERFVEELESGGINQVEATGKISGIISDLVRT